MIALWLKGLIHERQGRLAGTIAGITLTVGLLAALGGFLGESASSMTRRAISGVPVDWQIEVAPGIDPSSIAEALRKAAAVEELQTIGYADAESLEAATVGTVQTTGQGKVLGMDSGYRHAFPGQFRLLLGDLDGIVLAQQTAANLHATVGDTVAIHRTGLPPVEVRVGGVAELPNANSMFQAVGAPAGAGPQAPPDNVLLLPIAQWHRYFDPQAAVRPDSVRMQLHVGLDHTTLPDSPQAAYLAVQRAAHNLEVRMAGSGMVADNLGARLASTRSDASYSKVLFLFLGTPGALLAALLTLAVAASGADKRRRDQALLRLRGAPPAVILKLAAAEAACVGVAGAALGLGLAAIYGRPSLRIDLFSPSLAGWSIAAAAAGLVLAAVSIVLPAWFNSRNETVSGARLPIGRHASRIWRRIGLDYVFIVLAAIVFWRTRATGYQVVLAPEGVPAISIDYQSFLAPLLLWLGLGLLTVRLCLAGLERGRAPLAALLRPISGSLAGLAATAMSCQRNRITQGVALVALAFAFATSTAIFNTTYQAQALVDAELTNGADVTVAGTMQAPAALRLKELGALPGIAAAQPMHHRFAYVGADLQDLYGIDSRHIGEATRIANAYFQNGNAKTTLAKFAATADGILVSDETAKDFQLQLGDELNLRLQNASDHQYRPVKFHFIGVVREFPTAPRDSFLVANAAYVAQQTGADTAEVVLLKTSAPPADLAAAARKVVADLPGVKVSDIGEARHLIGSNLTFVDLTGLTRLELAFAVLMVAGSTGLVLSLGLTDRRKMFAVLSALGAKPRQLGAFIWSEAVSVFACGTVVGTAAGFVLAWLLIELLTGVFDPPPEALGVPWLYLGALIAVALASAALAVKSFERETHVPAVQRMREL